MAQTLTVEESVHTPRTEPDGRHEAHQSRMSSFEEPEKHSPGCPKYKVLIKQLRQARSPSRSNQGLHPKPWGARDPRQIPCTCGPVFQKSPARSPPPASVRSSPVREMRKTVRTESPLRKPPSPPTKEPVEVDGKKEVLKMFDEFCDRTNQIGVKLSCSTLNAMCHKIRTKFGTSGSVANASVRTSRLAGKKPAEAEKWPTSKAEIFEPRPSAVAEAFDKLQHQATLNREPSVPKSPSTIRGKLETSNVVMEISGSDFPEPGATFPNIFGAMMPHERPFHYVALGGGSQPFFGPPEMLVPPIPLLTLSDSNDNYIPMREVLSPNSPRRIPSPTRGVFPRRRP